MKRVQYLIVGLFIIMFILELVYIYYANKVTSDSIYGAKIKLQIAQYKEKNMAIRMEVLRLTSLDAISSRAQTLGYVEPKELISLYTPLQVALSK